MLITNINITDGFEQFQYVVEYLKQDQPRIMMKYIDGIDFDNNSSINDVIFANINENTIPLKFQNHWYTINTSNGLTNYLPQDYKMSTIRLYFPEYSLETYNTTHEYALTISTWIKGKCIILGSFIINRVNALACNGVKNYFNEQYYEYIEYPIIDPFDLIYSDNWQTWRQNICGESSDINIVNSVGSILYCTLHPVKKYENEYIKLDNYDGGQNAIFLTENKNDFLNLNISSNIDRSLKRTERPAIECQVNFNEYYNGELQNYLKETYGGDDWLCKYELVIGDTDNIYAVCESPFLTPTTTYKFTKDDINKYNFDNGIGWHEGINIKCSFELFKNNESSIYILSNNLPLTQRLFSYFVKSDFKDPHDYIINNVNLEDIDMNILNINAVNKTENKIIKVTHPNTLKNGIAQTIFYRTVDFPSIVIHPAVNENICINLDSYKHLVKSFILQVEGIKFIEIGRLKSGVIFKVFGSRLPQKINSGQYYILNQDSEMIASGKYIYEI